MFLWYKLLCLVAVTCNVLACDDVKRNVSQSEVCNSDLVYKAKALSTNISTHTREVTFKLLDFEEYLRVSPEAHKHWYLKSISIVQIPYANELQCDSKFPSSDQNEYLVLASLNYQNAKWSDKLLVPDCSSLIDLNCIDGDIPYDICDEPEN